MGMQTLKCTWNMRVNVYSHAVLPRAKQDVTFGVPNKQNRAEYSTFLSRKITGNLGKGELLKLC